LRADTVREFERRKAVVRKLVDDSQLEALLALKRGDITIESLVEADRAGRLKGAAILADLKLRGNFWAVVNETLPAMGLSKETRRRYGTSFRTLGSISEARLGPNARVQDLASVPWTKLRAAWDRAGKSAADWNHLRRAVSRFLTVLLGDVHHAFRHQVIRQIPTAKEGRGRMPELTVDGFWSIVNATPEHARPCYVTLAATGMRLKEYLSCTKENQPPPTHAIAVPGTKTAESADTVYVAPELWQWIEAGIPSTLQSRWMHIYWWRACVAKGFGRYEPVLKDGAPVIRTVRLRTGKEVSRPAMKYTGLRLHDLRHLYAQLASDQGAPTAKVQAALRHADPKMTRRYEMRRAKGDVARLVGKALTADVGPEEHHDKRS
jgi:integrase